MEELNRATSVWLVRHGEPAAERRNVCCVPHHTGLSETGRSQMAGVAEYLMAQSIAAIYCSPLLRALESARILADARGWPLEVVPDLRELDFGDFTGLTFDEIALGSPELYWQWMNTPTGVSFPNGESFRDMQARVLQSLELIRHQQAGHATVIVSHAGVNRVLIAHALGMPDTNLFRLDQDYAAVNLLRFVNDIPSLHCLNHRVATDGGLPRLRSP